MLRCTSEPLMYNTCKIFQWRVCKVLQSIVKYCKALQVASKELQKVLKVMQSIAKSIAKYCKLSQTQHCTINVLRRLKAASGIKIASGRDKANYLVLLRLDEE